MEVPHDHLGTINHTPNPRTEYEEGADGLLVRLLDSRASNLPGVWYPAGAVFQVVDEMVHTGRLYK